MNLFAVVANSKNHYLASTRSYLFALGWRQQSTMVGPSKEILYNKMLSYKLYIHMNEASKSHPFTLSLSENPQNTRAIFAWSQHDNLEKLHENVVENGTFMKLVQETIANNPDVIEYLFASKAKALGEGWLPLVDDRAMAVFGRAADSDDVIGMVRADEGRVDPSSYTPMPTYRLVSRLGVFSLPKVFHQKLLKSLE